MADDLRAMRREDFEDEDGDRKPDDILLELEPFGVDLGPVHEARFHHGVAREPMKADLARIGPAGRDEALHLAWPELEPDERCDRPAREPDCLVFDWSADLEALFFGTPLRVEATGDDVGSDDLEFSWDWGDGTAESVRLYFNDGLGPVPRPSPHDRSMPATDEQEHRFVGSSEYPLTLTLTDDDGGRDVRELLILKLDRNSAPVIDESSLSTSDVFEDPHDAGHAHGRNRLLVELTMSDSDSDPLVVTIDWGDGEVERASLPFEGDPADGAAHAPLLSVRHEYRDAGVYDVVVSVEDGAGGQDSFEFPVVTAGN